MTTSTLALVFCLSQPQPATTHRVVMHINENFQPRLLFRNVERLRKAFAPEKVEIDMVFEGPAVTYLANKIHMGSYIEGWQKSVRFVACEESLNSNKVRKDQLLKGVEIVPLGIAEVVRKQEAGWSYLAAAK